ncbi:MAG: ABC transporter permease [Chloroflexi bacterium]|nr:ABC transporter permease [Chloroflexota bacterium]
MIHYIIRRLLQTIPLLFILSLMLFTLVNIVPGGPLAGQGRSRGMRPEKAAILKRQMGLDQPLPIQYVVWLVGNDWMAVDADGDGVNESKGDRLGILRGDFGLSFRSKRPVLIEISERLLNTIYLVGIALVVTFLLAIPIGILSAIKQYSPFDIGATTLSFMGQSIPAFWLGLILILIFYTWLENPFTGEALLPPGGMQTLGYESTGTFDLEMIWDRIKHLILPVTVLLVGWVAWYSRFLRSSMLDVIHQDYIKAARAKGLHEKTVRYHHALKNAAIPLITMLALDIPFLFTGALYTELLFSWPGMGRLYYTAATGRDYPVLMAILIISAGLVFICNLLADIGYAGLDPRVRFD